MVVEGVDKQLENKYDNTKYILGGLQNDGYKMICIILRVGAFEVCVCVCVCVCGCVGRNGRNVPMVWDAWEEMGEMFPWYVDAWEEMGEMFPWYVDVRRIAYAMRLILVKIILKLLANQMLA